MSASISGLSSTVMTYLTRETEGAQIKCGLLTETLKSLLAGPIRFRYKVQIRSKTRKEDIAIATLRPACIGLDAGGSTLSVEVLMSIRPVRRLLKSKPALEGAGVHLRRAFGFGNTSDFDPFLLLDDFRNDVPDDYLAGFPWHPHRGIETITYVLAGTVEHGDSMGNRGSIASGDVQWMTAGSGIIHQEMPKGDRAGRMHGFQLWANLPSSLKMTPPRYQEVKAAEIPVITDDDGTHVRLVCGKFWGKRGPVDGIAADPIYLDVSVPPGQRKTLPIETTRHAFAYVFAGSAKFCNASYPLSVP